MLDRLQEHQRVALALPQLHHAALEGEVVALVAQPGVLVRLGVGVDTDDRGRAPRQDVRAVPLPAGHVDHPVADRARADPLVDDEVATKPVVLLGDVGQRALAGEAERRDALGLVALEVELGHGGAERTAGAARSIVGRHERGVGRRHVLLAVSGLDRPVEGGRRGADRGQLDARRLGRPERRDRRPCARARARSSGRTRRRSSSCPSSGRRAGRAGRPRSSRGTAPARRRAPWPAPASRPASAPARRSTS